MRRHPMIVFVDRPAWRRAAVMGRPRLSVAQVIETVRASRDVNEAAAYLDLEPAKVERVLEYYGEFRQEIDAEIERRHEIADREHRLWRERQLPLER